MIRFFGVVPATGCFACNDPLCNCIGTPTPTPFIDGQGRRVFVIGNPSGFKLVLEAEPGLSGSGIGSSVPPPTPGAGVLPDLQIQSTNPLGNGSSAICDLLPVNQGGGGVPGFATLNFGPSNAVVDALVDFACRFEPFQPGAPCTLSGDGNEGTLTKNLPTTGRQFCSIVGGNMSFPLGDTQLTAQVRDTSGARNLGPPVRIVVRRIVTP